MKEILNGSCLCIQYKPIHGTSFMVSIINEINNEEKRRTIGKQKLNSKYIWLSVYIKHCHIR